MATIPIYDSRNRISERQLETRSAPYQDPREISVSKYVGLGDTMMRIGEHYTKIADSMQETKAQTQLSRDMDAIQERARNNPDQTVALSIAKEEMVTAKESAAENISNAFNRYNFDRFATSQELQTTSQINNYSRQIIENQKRMASDEFAYKMIEDAIASDNYEMKLNELHLALKQDVALGIRSGSEAATKFEYAKNAVSSGKYNAELARIGDSPTEIEALQKKVSEGAFGFSESQKNEALIKLQGAHRTAINYQRTLVNQKNRVEMSKLSDLLVTGQFTTDHIPEMMSLPFSPEMKEKFINAAKNPIVPSFINPKVENESIKDLTTFFENQIRKEPLEYNPEDTTTPHPINKVVERMYAYGTGLVASGKLSGTKLVEFMQGLSVPIKTTETVTTTTPKSENVRKALLAGGSFAGPIGIAAGAYLGRPTVKKELVSTITAEPMKPYVDKLIEQQNYDIKQTEQWNDMATGFRYINRQFPGGQYAGKVISEAMRIYSSMSDESKDFFQAATTASRRAVLQLYPMLAHAKTPMAFKQIYQDAQGRQTWRIVYGDNTGNLWAKE